MYLLEDADGNIYTEEELLARDCPPCPILPVNSYNLGGAVDNG